MTINGCSKRCYVKGFPKSWMERNDDACWKLFNALSDYITIDNIAIMPSKYGSSFFGMLDVFRTEDVRILMEKLDGKGRLYIEDEKCHLVIKKFIQPSDPSKPKVTIVYSREALLALRKLGNRPPNIPASVYHFIKKREAKKKN